MMKIWEMTRFFQIWTMETSRVILEIFCNG
jgi:hypothetical protein